MEILNQQSATAILGVIIPLAAGFLLRDVKAVAIFVTGKAKKELLREKDDLKQQQETLEKKDASLGKKEKQIAEREAALMEREKRLAELEERELTLKTREIKLNDNEAAVLKKNKVSRNVNLFWEKEK